jgi:hypothetical protein
VCRLGETPWPCLLYLLHENGRGNEKERGKGVDKRVKVSVIGRKSK